MKQVKFSQMKNGDKEDYNLLSNYEDKHINVTEYMGMKLVAESPHFFGRSHKDNDSDLKSSN